MTTHDFGTGPVPAHQHSNGGGWIADTATVAETAYVGPNAKIFGNARICNDAQIYGNAQIYNNARIYGNAQIYGYAQIYGNSLICDDALIYDNARISNPNDILWGHLGGFNFTAYKLQNGSVFLQYGCEGHDLQAWEGLHEKLALKHNKPGHEKWTYMATHWVKEALAA